MHGQPAPATFVDGDARARWEVRLARTVHAIATRLSRSRVALTLCVCVLVSTQALFQPQLYAPLRVADVMQAWLEYAVECLLMGVPIALALTAVEVSTRGRGRVATVLAVSVALPLGAMFGAVLLVPYYDLGWDAVLAARFWLDITFWMAIGGGIAATYAFHQRAMRAAAMLHAAQIEQAALSRQMLEARLQVMRAQIEPHFLFNTLANAKRLCQTDVRDGVTMLDNLIRYLRAALPRFRDERATLGQEAELVRAYLAVLKIRMGDRLTYDIRVAPAIRGSTFPPMMLLTLAENAIKHGLNPSAAGGSVVIDATSHDGVLDVAVVDDGVGFGAAAAAGTGVGLANTRARLAALHGDRASLELAPNVPRGVVARIRVPLGEGANAAPERTTS